MEKCSDHPDDDLALGRQASKATAATAAAATTTTFLAPTKNSVKPAITPALNASDSIPPTTPSRDKQGRNPATSVIPADTQEDAVFSPEAFNADMSSSSALSRSIASSAGVTSGATADATGGEGDGGDVVATTTTTPTTTGSISSSSSSGEEDEDTIVVCGYGPVGETVVQFLRSSAAQNALASMRRTNYVVFDLDPSLVIKGYKKGVRILYGDGSQPMVLQTADVSAPKAFVVTYGDPEANFKAVERIRQAFPTAPIYAR